MIDSDFKVYLIEVNTNPCFEDTCPVLAKIIPEVLDGAFRIAVDPIFTYPESFASKPSSTVYFSECKYELVFDDSIEGKQLLDLYNKEDL